MRISKEKNMSSFYKYFLAFSSAKSTNLFGLCCLIVVCLMASTSWMTGQGTACTISNVSVQNETCLGSAYTADVCFDYENPLSTEVVISFNGEHQGLFAYPAASGGCITVTSNAPGDGSAVTVVVSDFNALNELYISEFHYDNIGTDVNEQIELTGEAGFDVAGWRIVFYNGADGSVITTIFLSGIIGDQGSGCGTLLVPASGIQNGPADGIALVDPLGAVVEFISYEGEVMAIDGPAAGRTSVDVDVDEDGTSTTTQSISFDGMTWIITDPASFGTLNDGAVCFPACDASVTFGAPICCDDIAVEAISFCSDASNSFMDNQYYVEVTSISGGLGSGSFDVTVAGVTQTYSGAALVFGPFAHSGVGGSVQAIAVAEGTGNCVTILEINETLCTDLSGDGTADNSFSSCDCIQAAQGIDSGIVFAQAQSGTFTAGGTSNYTQSYILTSVASGNSVALLGANETGLFTGLAEGDYFVFAVNYDNMATEVSAALESGTVDLTALLNNTAPYDGDCYVICGPATYAVDCSESILGLACNGHVNISVGPECDINQISVNNLLETDSNAESSYTITIATDNGFVIDHLNMTSATSDDVVNFLGDDLVFTINHICSGTSCWGTVTFEDKTPPTLNCDCPVGGEDLDGDGTMEYAPECIFSCYDVALLEGNEDYLLPSDISEFVDNSIVDNCQQYTVESVSFEDDFNNIDPCENGRLVRTWSVTFASNTGAPSETVTCEREYIFQPLSFADAIEAGERAENDPIVNNVYLPVKTVFVDCNTSIGLDPSAIEQTNGVREAYPHVYVNSSSPTALPIWQILCNVATSFTDVEFEGCAENCIGNRKVIRQWSLLDWCSSEVHTYDQIIKVSDEDAPVILVAGPVTVEASAFDCTATVDLPAPSVLADFCDENITYQVTGTSGGHTISGSAGSGFTASRVGFGETKVYYQSEDCCGNIGFDTLVVHVTDNVAPYAVAIDFIAVTMTQIGSEPEDVKSKLFARSVDNGSLDNCTDVTLAVRRLDVRCEDENAEFREFVTFCCEDMLADGWRDNLVELLVTDEFGNTSLAITNVILQSNEQNVLSCPEGLVVKCDETIDDLEVTGLPMMSGICGDIDLPFFADEVVDGTVPSPKPASAEPFYDRDGDGEADAVPAFNEDCGYGALRRDFINAGDIICTQYFVVEPNQFFNENDIVWPQDMISNCSDSDPGEPIFTAPACSKTGFSVESDTLFNVPFSCYRIVNTWTVIDWCEYEATGAGIYESIQNIDVQDDSRPLLSAQDMTVSTNQDCVAESVTVTATATDADNCNQSLLLWTASIDLDGNGVADEVETFHAMTEDTVSVTFTDLDFNKSGYIITWTAEDLCGNKGTTTSTLVVTDITAPRPYCIEVSTNIENGKFEFWAVEFNGGAEDNCSASSSLRFTFSDQEPPAENGFYNPIDGQPATESQYNEGLADSWNREDNSAGRRFDVADLDSDGRISIPVYIWDECGNFEFCVVNPGFGFGLGMSTSIEGHILTEDGQAVQQVETQIMSNMPGYPAHEMTDGEGTYAFMVNPMNQNYVINGEKNDDYLNGISTLDLVVIQRHILGISPLDSPYKMIAADVNNDNRINGIDLVELRKLILGVYAAYPESDSWRFVDAAQELDVTNPWIYNESLSVFDLDTSMVSEDFIGVKIGDVNSSVVANVVNQSIELRGDAFIDFVYEDRNLQLGEVFELDLVTDANDIFGFQFAIGGNLLEVLDVAGRDIYDDNFVIKDGRLTISHNSDFPMQTDGGFLTLVLKTNAEGALSDLLKMHSSVKAEAYLGKFLEEFDIRLRSYSDSVFKLYQNKPNPFMDETIIEFELPEASRAKLVFYDVTGQLLRSVSGNYNKGYNALRISKSEIGASGLIYYQLESGTYTAMKHMMLLE